MYTKEYFNDPIQDYDGLNVKIKKLHPDAIIPSYAKDGDAGMDLTAISMFAEDCGIIGYKTGLAVEIPFGYVGLLFPRSSISKKDLILSNHVGVIDSGYRGEIMMKFREQRGIRIFEPGERIGQLIIMPYPKINFIEVDELSETERGTGGYGSSGK